MGKLFSRAAIVIAVIVIIIVAALSLGTASGHGTLDQTFTGNPDCNSSNFKGSLATGQPIYQEFVPSLPQLVAVDVCSDVFQDGGEVKVNIRNGSAASPGPVIASMSLTGNIGNFQWLHFDLPQPLPVFAGQTLVIEMPTTLQHDWISTCGEVFGTCDHIDQDEYTAGDSSAGSPRDFVFRSYGGEGPGATPRPAVTSKWGDLDCSRAVDLQDGLAPLKAAAGLHLQIPPDCPPIGSVVNFQGALRAWGDLRCDGVADAGDALVELDAAVGILMPGQPVGCPNLDDTP